MATIDQSAPAKIVVQVMSCDTMKTAHPSLQPTIVGIDVLDVEDALKHLEAALHIDRAEHGDDMRCVEFPEAEVVRLTAAVAYHPNGDLIGAGASGLPDAAASASRSWQAALRRCTVQARFSFSGYSIR